MPRPRSRIVGWTYNDTRQELQAPSGRIITLDEITKTLADHRDCCIDFAGPWMGWRMRHQFLIPPTGSSARLTPSNARRFAEWVNEPLRAISRSQRATESADPHRHLRSVQGRR